MTHHWDKLAQAISAARAKREWSQEQLAKAAGLSRSTVQAFERGHEYQRVPASLYVLGRALGWPDDAVDTLLAGGEPATQGRPAEGGQEGAGARRRQTGMPLRVAEELESGDVVETAVVDLSDHAKGVRLIAVLKADDATQVSRDDLREAVERWVQAERRLRGLPAAEEDPESRADDS